MGWRGTVLLLAVVVAATLFLYYDVNGGRRDGSWSAIFAEPQDTPPADQITHLVALDAASVTAIRVRSGDREWQATRTADGWSGVGRSSDVDEFLRDVGELAEILPIEIGPDTLRDHGLDPPQGSIELLRRDAPPLLLLIGSRNPPATGVYVRVGADGPVALTGALLLWDVEKFQRAATTPTP